MQSSPQRLAVPGVLSPRSPRRTRCSWESAGAVPVGPGPAGPGRADHRRRDGDRLDRRHPRHQDPGRRRPRRAPRLLRPHGDRAASRPLRRGRAAALRAALRRRHDPHLRRAHPVGLRLLRRPPGRSPPRCRAWRRPEGPSDRPLAPPAGPDHRQPRPPRAQSDQGLRALAATSSARQSAGRERHSVG